MKYSKENTDTVRNIDREDVAMKHIVLSLTFVILCLLAGCSSGNGLNPFLPSGRTTLTTTYVNNTATGFSFSAGGIITMPNAQNRKPDFMVAVWTNVDGAVLGTFFGASAQEVFRLMGHFNTLDSAQTFFQNLIDVPGGSYDFVALPVEKNQVWIVKTREGRYGKILIRNTLAYNDTSHLPLHNSYAEATFDWIYQPNGTSRF